MDEQDKKPLSPVPETHETFRARFPELGQAWELIHAAGKKGPLDERTCRLIKLAAALGAMREGAVHSNVRKAKDLGVSDQEIEQVVALAAGALSLPATVAVYSWVRDILEAKAK